MEKNVPIFRPYTKRSEYAIRALAKLVPNRKNGKVKVNEILRRTEIPEHFTRKVLRLLVKSRFLKAVTGPDGGYQLRRDPGEITLAEIIEAVEGKRAHGFNQCILGRSECTDQEGCLLHRAWMKAKESMVSELQSTTLKDLMRKEAGQKL